MSNLLSNRQEIEKYIIDKLHNIYAKYQQPIDLNTTFDQLESGVESDLVGAHLFIDIEADLDIEIAEDETETLNAAGVCAVVDCISRKLRL
jgi:acyl carrier protein